MKYALPAVTGPHVPGTAFVVGRGATRIGHALAPAVGAGQSLAAAGIRRADLVYELVEYVGPPNQETQVIVEVVTQFQIDENYRTDFGGGGRSVNRAALVVVRPVIVGAYHQVQFIRECRNSAEDETLVRVAVFYIFHVRSRYGFLAVYFALAGHVNLVVAEGKAEVRADCVVPVQRGGQHHVHAF